MQYQWFYKYQGNEEKVKKLSKSLNISIPNAQLLVQRGIETFDEAKTFFRPQLDNLYDPFLMKDMQTAVDRLSKAINNKESILIYGDYDVDGTTSVALVYSFLKKYHSHIDFYIPNRDNEGYGISYKGIDYAKEKNQTLIIALDCGIKAVDKIDYANQHNIDFIICDHHLPAKKLPNACAILNSKQKDCNYPDKNLSGCGVGFKFMQAFAQQNNISKKELFSFLDLVAISIASDIVPIIGENRILAYYGLQKLNSQASIGLQSLIQIAQLENKEITISDIVFKIGPRINAAGRIKTAKSSVQLLIEQDYTKAKEYANAINTTNTERQQLDKTITEEALQIIKKDPLYSQKKSTIVYAPNWHKGVVGIVASRLIEHHYRPTIVLSKNNNLLTGSARSVDKFNIYEALDACSDLIENYGGHQYAAGLSLKEENLDAFIQKFEEYVETHITNNLLIPKIEIDLDIKLSEINNKFYNIIKQMAPFGPENMAPVFSTKKVRDNGKSKVVGKDLSHLKIAIKDQENNQLEGIAFKMGAYYPMISEKTFDICYSLSINEFRNVKKLQMEVKDIRESI